MVFQGLREVGGGGGGGEVRGFWKLHCTQLQQFSKAQCTVASIPDCSSCAYIHYVHVVYSVWIKHCVRTLFKAYTMLKSTVCDIFYFAKYQRTSVLSLENIPELKNVVRKGQCSGVSD